MFDFKKLIKKALFLGASDLHIKVGNFPHIRVQGELFPVEGAERTQKDDTVGLVSKLLNQRQRETLSQQSEVDMSIGITDLGRFRVSVFQQRGTISFAFRLIPSEVGTISELNLPPVIDELSDETRGLILVTGVTGSGKSTTLASMIRHINETRKCHILTIEDPIEFLIKDQESIISQREVGTDTISFDSALRTALRQDPDVIMVGEMRDPETVNIALQAAQTGHLVMSTLHTTDAASTIHRIVSIFPESQHSHIRHQFASALNAIVSMRLLKSSTTGRLMPAIEILRNTELIQSLIVDPLRTKEINSSIENLSGQYGMQTFDQSLLALMEKQLISKEDALAYASKPKDLTLKIKGIETL